MSFPTTGQDLEVLLHAYYTAVLKDEFWWKIVPQWMAYEPSIEADKARVDAIIEFMLGIQCEDPHTEERIQSKLDFHRDEFLRDKKPFHVRIFLGTATDEDYAQHKAWTEAEEVRLKASHEAYLTVNV